MDVATHIAGGLISGTITVAVGLGVIIGLIKLIVYLVERTRPLKWK